MPTDFIWLDVLLKSQPDDYLTNDDSAVIALVRTGLLEAVHCWNEFMQTWDTRYVLTAAGAHLAAESGARVHAGWKAQLAAKSKRAIA